jgi:hypothetical protein
MSGIGRASIASTISWTANRWRVWFDRTKEYSARNRGKTISPGQFATTETVTLSPLPCWEHLSPEQIRARVEAIVQRIEETAAKGREESGSAVLGATAVRAQKPFDQPARPGLVCLLGEAKCATRSETISSRLKLSIESHIESPGTRAEPNGSR